MYGGNVPEFLIHLLDLASLAVLLFMLGFLTYSAISAFRNGSRKEAHDESDEAVHRPPAA